MIFYYLFFLIRIEKLFIIILIVTFYVFILLIGFYELLLIIVMESVFLFVILLVMFVYLIFRELKKKCVYFVNVIYFIMDFHAYGMKVYYWSFFNVCYLYNETN
jgi:hypothetical protein